MSSAAYSEPEERTALREAVNKLASTYGQEYMLRQARAGLKSTEMWREMGRHGYLGVSIPEEYGGGGGGIADLAAVMEEVSAVGAPLLAMVVSPAIGGTVITQFGTDDQKREWLPGIADGTSTMAFAITEPDAGSNSHNITTSARRDGGEWVLTGQKTYISAVDEADTVLVVARDADAKSGRLVPHLFIVPTDAPGFTRQPIEMEIIAPERQFTLFFDEVRLPPESLLGDQDSGMKQLFAGLNPERVVGAALSNGTARFALDKAVAYAKTREVWGKPIGAHQGVAHPLARVKVELEMSRLLQQKAAEAYDRGDASAGELANMAKYAAGEAACNATDIAVHTHGGNGLSQEYGLAAALVAARLSRIGPVSREMILNFVSTHTLGLPKSY